MTIIVLHNQSLLDVAVQHTGNVLNAFLIAKANGLQVSSEPAAGTTLIIPEDVQNDRDILDYYTSKKIHPATGITNILGITPSEPELEGISYWAIYDDFIVQ